jgi:hypothetical protein
VHVPFRSFVIARRTIGGENNGSMNIGWPRPVSAASLSPEANGVGTLRF